jgi:hypothetical protein
LFLVFLDILHGFCHATPIVFIPLA